MCVCVCVCILSLIVYSSLKYLAAKVSLLATCTTLLTNSSAETFPATSVMSRVATLAVNPCPVGCTSMYAVASFPVSPSRFFRHLQCSRFSVTCNALGFPSLAPLLVLRVTETLEGGTGSGAICT